MDIINFFSENPNAFIVLVAIGSLIIGSFLNVVVYRLPRMIMQQWNQECREYLGLKSNEPESAPLNLCLPHSHCPHCQQSLKVWHNIPLISYLVLGGKCAYCSGKISTRYPLIEALTCFASVYVAWRFGFSWQTGGALLFTWILIALTFIDLDYHLLPDQLTLFLLGIGLFLSLFTIFCPMQDAIIGTIAGYLIFAFTQWIFKFATGKVGMGEGDFKFLAALGAFLGWQMLPIIILLASISGVIFSLTHMLIKHQFKSVALPFGPYLAMAGWISLIWGHDIMRLYMHTMIN
jgi:leader peptidase (prepilin peptidase)/N-methyltransferase